MGVSGQRHVAAALYPREGTSGTHWIGGWVGLRAGLDRDAKGKIFATAAVTINNSALCAYGIRIILLNKV
jgi:hypothetical protein